MWRKPICAELREEQNSRGRRSGAWMSGAWRGLIELFKFLFDLIEDCIERSFAG